MQNLNEMLGSLSEFLKTEAKTETIIGQQFQLGAYSCVPVMSVGFGFGGGGGEGKGKGANGAKGSGEGEGTGLGGGVGMGMAPVGFLVTKGDDIQFIPARSSKGLGAAFEKLPDVLEKFMESRKQEA